MKTSYPRFNWGRGRLLPYESRASFAAKFCALNGIKPAQFSKFFGSIFGENWWWHQNFSYAELKKLALLLDESYSSVRTLHNNETSLEQSGIFSFHEDRHSGYRTLIYCPCCIEHGYHSAFHERCYLKKCPFHNISLERQWSLLYRGGAIFDRYVSDLTDLLNSTPCDWLKIHPGKPEGISTPLFRQFEQWMPKIKQSISELTEQHIWPPNIGKSWDWRTNISRIQALHAMPKKIQGLFTDVPQNWKCAIDVYGKDAATDLSEILKMMSFDHLIWFYKLTGAHAISPTPFTSKLDETIGQIKAIHGRCHCDWGWNRYDGWSRVRSDDWPHWAQACPFNVAIEDLKFNWGSFFYDVKGKENEETWLAYVNAAPEFKALNLIKYSDHAAVTPVGHLYSLPRVIPCVEWTASAVLTGLLNAILIAEIKGRGHVLHQWVQSLDKGPGRKYLNFLAMLL